MRNIFIFFICFSFSLFSERVHDINRYFPEEFKISLEHRLDKLSKDHDIGVYIFPFEIGSDLSIQQKGERVFNKILSLEKDSSNINSYNFIFYGLPEDGLNFFDVKLTSDEKPRSLESDLMFNSIVDRFANEIQSNQYVDYKAALNESISFIEKAINPEPKLEFHFGLEGWPCLVAFGIALIVWFYTKRYLFILLAGLVEGVCFVLFTGCCQFDVIFNFIGANIAIIIFLFMIEAVVLNPHS